LSEIIFYSATSLAQAIREKRVSSAEVVDACLRRIEAINPKLNALVQLTADNARQRARELDDALARGEIAGPLHGVPFTVKDWIETNDAVCAAGRPERAQFVPKRDATVVARMRAAGGVILGKTLDGVAGATNAVYGVCHNPYDLARTPGESSSGEASIIAAGGSPVGLGSDSGGSLRYPAHCCGVATLKPSAGRVPLTGHFPRIDSMIDTRTQIGPLARSVRDLALVLPIIAGPDGRDAGIAPVPLGDWRAVDLRGLRVATFEEFPRATPGDDTRTAVRDACRALVGAGAIVEEACPPRIDESWEITMMYWSRVESYSWSEWRPDKEHTLTADDIERGLFAWGRLRRDMLAFMGAYDAIVCPAAPGPAAPLADKHGPAPFAFTLPFSLTGWPVVAVRAGASNEGLPIGVQVAARPWRDDVALALAGQIEASLGGWQAPNI